MNFLSQKVLYIIGFLLLLSFLFYQPKKSNICAASDTSGYYGYLPAVFIYGDINTLDQCNAARKKYSARGKATTKKLPNGNHLNQYTYGVAFLNAPAFGIAHLFCKLSPYPTDGYSAPYNFAIMLNGLLYIFAGFFFLRKFLLVHFSEKAVALTLIALALGSNLYFTAVLQSAMAHGYLFGLIALLLWLTQQWLIKKQDTYFWGIAFLMGLISVIRPNVIIVGLVPLMLATDQVFLLFRNVKKILLGAFLFLLPWLPQFAYWKSITGHYLTYSYGKQGFDFLHPHIVEGLLGFKNGWLTYSPLMAIAILGLFIGLFKKQRLMCMVFIIAVIHVYIIYSWWCWNYINGFGSRAMIDIYPLLAVPMALLFEQVQSKKPLQKTVYLTMCLLITLNLFQTHQYYLKVLWSEGGNFAYYKSIFGKSHLDEKALIALDCNIVQPEHLKLKKQLASESFDMLQGRGIDSTRAVSGQQSFCIGPGLNNSKGITTQLQNPDQYQNDWLRVSAQCLSTGYGTIYENSHLVLHITRQGKKLLWKSVRINNKIRDEYYSVHNGEINRWKEVYFYVPLHELDLKSSDDISVFGWNPSGIRVCLDDLQLNIFGMKEKRK